MRIGFFHVDTDREACGLMRLCARGLVKSARKTMPGVEIVHFTDLTTKGIKGVDEVRRKPSEPMGLLRIRHNAGVPGEWVFVDTDVYFQESVQHVFKLDFDVAVTQRDWSHLKAAGGFSDRMPFNTGVVFSRCPRFWSDVYTRMRDTLEPEQQEWMGEQQAICDVAGETDRYAIRQLPGSRFNFPPAVPGLKPVSRQEDAAILHYKGPDRKRLMVKRIEREFGRCA